MKHLQCEELVMLSLFTQIPSKGNPIGSKEVFTLGHDELEPLSQIIRELNEQFGADFTEDDKLCIREIEQRLADNAALEASVRVNPPENARLTFDAAPLVCHTGGKNCPLWDQMRIHMYMRRAVMAAGQPDLLGFDDARDG